MANFDVGHHMIQEEGGVAKVSALIAAGESDFDLWYRLPRGPICESAEPFLAALVLAAMKARRAIRLEAPVSPRFLSALSIISAIYELWFDDIGPLAVSPARVEVPVRPEGRETACFFSGGLDSFDTLFRHLDEIDTLVLVHGFDVRIGDAALWERVSGPLHQAAAELGKRLLIVQTNLQEFSQRFFPWEDYYGAGMASVAHLLSARFSKMYFAAAQTYADLDPSGVHPLLDPLWSSEAVEIVHDGAEFGRIQKAARLGANPVAMKYLRVCWQTPAHSWRGKYNCGQCTKCIRTQVNLHLAGVLDRCQTLPHEIDLDAVRRLPTANPHQHAYALENLREAERQNADPDLILALQQSLGHGGSDRQARPASTAAPGRLGRLQQENGDLRAELGALYNSKSWRITHLLRSLMDVVRRAHKLMSPGGPES